MLGEGSTDDINGSIEAAKKKFGINFSKAKTKFCITIVIRVICLLMEKKSISLKLIIKMLAF